ncbi:MAG: cellulose biosynthesis protein BcsS [Pseudolabrys sp.]|nr:cellulose biosynthesis protein BcsS [Pseudolabrys sp.]
MVRRRVRAAALLAAAFLVCVCRSSGPSKADEGDDQRVLQFSGRDIWRNGAFVHGGLIYAPRGFERDGFMLKLVLDGGVYRYSSGSLGQDVIGVEWGVQALPGFRIKRGDAEMKFFFGPELQHHKLRPDDTANRLRDYLFGLRMAGELWYEPTPGTLIAGDASLSTLASGRSARLAYGWRIAEELFTYGVYVGPEVQYFGSEGGYHQRRIGLHMTSMKTEATEWSASIGFAIDTIGRSSPYARLGLSQKITD